MLSPLWHRTSIVAWPFHTLPARGPTCLALLDGSAGLSAGGLPLPRNQRLQSVAPRPRPVRKNDLRKGGQEVERVLDLAEVDGESLSLDCICPVPGKVAL